MSPNRNSTRRVQIACLLGAWLLVTATQPIVSAASPEQQSADVRTAAERVADAVEFRSEFGFASDLATVSALLGDPTSDYSFGAPLSTKELANLQLRLDLREKANAAVAYIDSHPGDFGGVYFTQNTGELVMFIVSTDATPVGVVDQVVGLVPDGLTSKVVQVRHSMSELLEAERRLSLRWDELQINQLAVRVQDNELDLVLAPTAKASLVADIASVPMSTSYGPGPTEAACVDSSSCTPYRGGIGIKSPQANLFCTWGFYGTRGAAAKYMITAGHCANLGNTETHLSAQVTDGVDKNTFDAQNGTADAMTAHVLGSGNAVAPFNTIYASAAVKAHAILATKFTAQHVGDVICFMGGATGTSICGNVELTGLSYNLARETDNKVLHLTGQIQMNRVAKVGDSGGPVYQQNTAWGIVNAIIIDPGQADNGHMLYSPIDKVQAAVGTNVCVLNAC
jgi:hypothetical protein